MPVHNNDSAQNDFGITVSKTTYEDYEIEVRSKNGTLISQTILKKGTITSESFYVFSIGQINELLKKQNNISFIYRRFQNSYTIDEFLIYKDGILTEKRISVCNSKDECICFKLCQIENGEIVGESTEKSYFENGEEKYEFEYWPDGSCFMIYNVQAYQEDIWAKDIGTSKTTFTWDGFEYYKFANILVPE